MTIEVDLYRSDDYVRSERIALAPLLRSIFEPLLGVSLVGARIHLAFLPVAEENRLEGDPVVVNLRSGHGYANVRIVRDGVVLYQHPHSVREIVARPLQQLLSAREPDERHWGFGIVGSGLDLGALVRPAPAVEMSVAVQKSQPRMFHVEEIAEPEPPTATLAGLGMSGPFDVDGTVTPVLTSETYEALSSGMAFSDEVEEGGFLAGHVYTDAERPSRYLVVVTAVIRAERTGASLLHFTFTGESFTRAGDAIARLGRTEVLVGWYHSHLFPASDVLGLSSIDIDLHVDTFRRPWQVAGLVNITGTARLVRFYAANGDGVTQVAYAVSEP